MLIDIKGNDLDDARHANFLDEMDMIISPNDGKLVCVAMKYGMHCCWQCGEPFDTSDPQMCLVEKLPALTKHSTDDGRTRVGVHKKCLHGFEKKPFWFLVKGHQTRRAVADIVKKTQTLVDAAKSTAGRVIG